jgi:hypothetical protein
VLAHVRESWIRFHGPGFRHKHPCPTHLVDLAITNAGRAGESAAERESKGCRSNSTARAGRDGRASCDSRNAAAKGGNKAPWSAQLSSIASRCAKKASREASTYLLNILNDDKERLGMGLGIGVSRLGGRRDEGDNSTTRKLKSCGFSGLLHPTQSALAARATATHVTSTRFRFRRGRNYSQINSKTTQNCGCIIAF